MYKTPEVGSTGRRCIINASLNLFYAHAHMITQANEMWYQNGTVHRIRHNLKQRTLNLW